MEPLTDSLQDPVRLAALADTQLPDSAAEESFDRLTRMVTRLLGVPVALVSLVDDNRQFLVLAETGKQASIQFFKSQQACKAPVSRQRRIPQSHSFCQHVVIDRAPLVVTDPETVRASATISQAIRRHHGFRVCPMARYSARPS